LTSVLPSFSSSDQTWIALRLIVFPVHAEQTFYSNVTVGGGPAPVRAYIDELLPDILKGRIEPGRVFDRTVGLDGVPDGYRAMNDRESIKVMVAP
jgi:threonine dehydrogenase-like Zn-dependent dehydrogenase